MEIVDDIDEPPLPNEFMVIQGDGGMNDEDQSSKEPQEEPQPSEEPQEGILIELQEETQPQFGLQNEQLLHELDMEDELNMEDELHMEEESQPRLQLQLEGGDSDEDEQTPTPTEVSPINDEDGEIFLEIDIFGVRDLNEDERIDDEL